jgi:uncharacterized RDD family membrane protein YckC
MDNEAPLAEQPAQPEPSVSAAPALAGFWVRGGALLVDSTILMLCIFLPLHDLNFLVSIVYKTIFISQGGQTPGKMAAGIKVVTLTGEPIGVGRALARCLSEYLSAFLLAIGYMIAGFSDKRALHDYIVGTRVVYVDGVGAGRKAVFAFLGVLALVIPLAAIGAMAYYGVGSFGKFKTLTVKSGEGATKGNLGSLRSYNSIYYGDTEGNYPATLEALIGPKYLKEIPKTKIAAHMETNVWTAYGAEVCTGKTDFGTEIDVSKIKDTGGWGFVTDPKAPCYGMIFVDCTHLDSKGKHWPEY